MSVRRWAGPAGLLLLLAGLVGMAWHWGTPVRPRANPAASAGPRRIASLTLATDEILSGLVPAERVVAVTYLVDDPDVSNVPGYYPAGVPRLRDTGPEKVIALAPDLVCVAPYNTADSLRLLERSGLALYRNEDIHGIDEIEAGILRLGARVGEPGRADEVVAGMRRRRQALADRLGRPAHRPRVLFWSAGFTASRGTTMDDVIREAGGTNVAAELGLDGSAEVSPERAVAADPDVVLVARWSAEQRAGAVESHPILRDLRAVRAGRVIAIEGRYLTCVSQFVVEGTERLARRLHPECFAEEAPP